MKELNLEDILNNTEELKTKKVWYISIIWRPNTWKSTFVNTLIWEKVSITTNIPQTTRVKILAIYNDKDSQLIFIDTPWIHNSNKNFNEQINNNAINSIKESDVVLYFIDTSRDWWEEEGFIKKLLSVVNKPIIRVYTKSDLKPRINIPINKGSVKISSILKEWFDKLIVKIKDLLKESTIYFPEDFSTKQTLNFRISEIIREKVFLNTKEELPHSIYIQVEEINQEANLIKIVSYIYTETESQKYIIIWKKGALIWKIWKESRLELEDFFWKKVFLALRVKVNKNWRKDEKLLKNLLN